MTCNFCEELCNTSRFLPAGRGWRESGCSTDSNEQYLRKHKHKSRQKMFFHHHCPLFAKYQLSPWPQIYGHIMNPLNDHYYSHHTYQHWWHPLFYSWCICQGKCRNHLCPKIKQEMWEEWKESGKQGHIRKKDWMVHISWLTKKFMTHISKKEWCDVSNTK